MNKKASDSLRELAVILRLHDGWTVQSSDGYIPNIPNEERPKNMNTPNASQTTYDAATVASLALDLLTVSRTAWALTESNQKLQGQVTQKDFDIKQLQSLNGTLELNLEVSRKQASLSITKFKNLLEAFTIPVEQLQVPLRIVKQLKRLKCKSIGDAAVLDQNKIRTRTDRLLTLRALVLYLETSK